MECACEIQLAILCQELSLPNTGVATSVGYVLMPRRVQPVERVVPNPKALARLAKEEKLVMAPESEVRVKSDSIANKLSSAFDVNTEDSQEASVDYA
ncbi:hypothetical protein HG15A2_27950 [Adhaeretor mobilis]|uniref:Uncharacterized protein n=1 Tax=Adhaeretor mobilis TaxID=1930276 RepID=A0A517MX64_9BACT|nr:hypothetical protein HG15A2_27950 [Adhaeretor mobilis]